MSEKIQPRHLARVAVVYVRQSSPGQVKNNRESYRVQKGLTRRAEALGWAAGKIQVIEGDQGTSASVPNSRDDFNGLLQMVQDRQVGIVFGVDVARLARNSIDWSLLTHWCALHGALLGDQHVVYDPSQSQDSLVLGIQGVLAVHELHTIRNRLQAGLAEKASRGELHQGAVPRGYVVVEGKHLRKHPDRRVQQAIDRVFEEFETCTSVSRLTAWLWEHNHRLPRAVAGGDGTQVEWVQADYNRVLDLLKNPKYAGIYVYPRHQHQTNSLPCGKVRTTWRLSTPDEWSVVIRDHHPAYITQPQYDANQQKIAMNAQRYATSSSAPNKGASLLAGLIECRRCGHRMQVSYSQSGHASYSCRNGRRQRAARGDSSSDCFRFPADELERQLSEQILSAVSPAGVRAAELAAERLTAQRESRRSQLTDQLEQSCYEVDLARRRFNSVDPANRLVFDTLSQELELALQSVAADESALHQFDRDDPPRPTDEERRRLAELGTRVKDVWFVSHADGRLKQQIVRLLIEHASADMDESRDEVVLWLKWSGGHHTQLRAARRRRRGRVRVDLESILDTLRRIADDASISIALNRAGVQTSAGHTWTAKRVSAFRERAGIAAWDAALQEQEGWLTQRQTATYLGISPMSLNRLIQKGIVSTEGEPRLPQLILRETLASPAIQAAVESIKSHGNAPLPENPNQLSLFF